MLNKKSLICGLAGVFSVFYCFDLRAENLSQILFKLHEIKPLTNSDGIIEGCEYSATFYNRSGSDVATAQINLSWKDEVVAKDNASEQTQKQTTRSSRRGRYSRTNVVDTGDVFSSINLPPLKNDRQITLKNKVDTDKCFLLLNDAKFDVTSCSLAGKTGGDKGCANMFRFVKPDEQQYYVEFKSILAEEEVEQENAQYKQAVSNMVDAYDKVLASIQSISSSLLNKTK